MKVPDALRIGLWCIALISVANIASSNESKRVSIEVGTTSVPPYAMPWFQDQIESFRAAHPDIEVSTLALGDPQRPLNTLASVPRIAENVIGLQVPYEDELSFLLNQDLLVPIEAFIPDKEFDFSQYYDNVWPPVRRDGYTWGVPWNMTAHWLVCNWPLFEREGITEPPQTWEEFIDVAQQLTKDTDGDGILDQWGVRFDTGIGTAQLLWLTLDRQEGVEYEQDGEFDFDQPQIRENIQFLKQLCTADYAKMDSENRIVASDYQRHGMFFVHTFLRYLPRIPDQVREVYANPDFRFAAVPTSNRPADLMGPQLYLAIRRSTPEQERASWEFVKWINRPEADLPSYWLGFPCRKDFLDRDDAIAWGEKMNLDWQAPFLSMKRSERPAYGAHGIQLVAAMRLMVDFIQGRSTIDDTIEGLSQSDLLISEPATSRSVELLK